MKSKVGSTERISVWGFFPRFVSIPQHGESRLLIRASQPQGLLRKPHFPAQLGMETIHVLGPHALLRVQIKKNNELVLFQWTLCTT